MMNAKEKNTTFVAFCIKYLGFEIANRIIFCYYVHRAGTQMIKHQITRIILKNDMKKKKTKTWAVAMAAVLVGLNSCSLDIPKEVPSSYETITVEKSDIELPIKFSAKMKGQSDVTIMPQVSGQLMKICVNEGQQVSKGQTLFVIDSRNAQLELEAAQANLQAALAQENSAKLEYESNKNL